MRDRKKIGTNNEDEDENREEEGSKWRKGERRRKTGERRDRGVGRDRGQERRGEGGREEWEKVQLTEPKQRPEG